MLLIKRGNNQEGQIFPGKTANTSTYKVSSFHALNLNSIKQKQKKKKEEEIRRNLQEKIQGNYKKKRRKKRTKARIETETDCGKKEIRWSIHLRSEQAENRDQRNSLAARFLGEP